MERIIAHVAIRPKRGLVYGAPNTRVKIVSTCFR